MITESDSSYKTAKLIKQGKTLINPDFKDIAAFIEKRFNVKVINIRYDRCAVAASVKSHQNEEVPYISYDFSKTRDVPRLNVDLEFYKDYQFFHTHDDSHFIGYDKQKQKIIADNFAKLADRQKYPAKDLFVCFSQFENIAKTEANGAIPNTAIKQLQAELACPDLWLIQRCFDDVTFFLYTIEQHKAHEHSEIRKQWASRYYELLAPHDEFGYFKRETFDILLDSKENFDTNYESNWWYYYK